MAATEPTEEKLEGMLEWIGRSETLRWVFVGGKGGVGKTTVCCALAVQLARRNPQKRILVISTDPAHNTSDAFGQKFTREPTAVAGFANLHAMEVDASQATLAAAFAANNRQGHGQEEGHRGGLLEGLLPEIQEIAGSLPGIDEAVGFGEMLRQVRSLAYDLVLFDTAPTGHTLRLLTLPRTLQRGLSKLIALRTRFSGIFSGIARAIGGGGDDEDQEALREQEQRMQELLAATEEIVRQFRDPALTTFVPVLVAEFLSLYETERLVQQLARDGMDVSSLVINQLVPADCARGCSMCSARARMQARYIAQAEDLYGADFHIVKLPLLDHEIRGPDELAAFGAFLFSLPPSLSL